MDLQAFSRRITVLASEVEKNADAVVRKVALVADQAVVMATPVDTGRARSNWLVGLGTARQDVVGSHVPGLKGATGEANTQESILIGRATIKQRRPGQDIHITNNLDYIEDLNHGTSKQAPANFVEAAVAEAAEAVRNSRLLEGPVAEG